MCIVSSFILSGLIIGVFGHTVDSFASEQLSSGYSLSYDGSWILWNCSVINQPKKYLWVIVLLIFELRCLLEFAELFGYTIVSEIDIWKSRASVEVSGVDDDHNNSIPLPESPMTNADAPHALEILMATGASPTGAQLHAHNLQLLASYESFN